MNSHFSVFWSQYRFMCSVFVMIYKCAVYCTACASATRGREENPADKLDNSDKGLQALSQHSEGYILVPKRLLCGTSFF